MYKLYFVWMYMRRKCLSAYACRWNFFSIRLPLRFFVFFYCVLYWTNVTIYINYKLFAYIILNVDWVASGRFFSLSLYVAVWIKVSEHCAFTKFKNLFLLFYLKIIQECILWLFRWFSTTFYTHFTVTFCSDCCVYLTIFQYYFEKMFIGHYMAKIYQTANPFCNLCVDIIFKKYWLLFELYRRYLYFLACVPQNRDLGFSCLVIICNIMSAFPFLI